MNAIQLKCNGYTNRVQSGPCFCEWANELKKWANKVKSLHGRSATQTYFCIYLCKFPSSSFNKFSEKKNKKNRFFLSMAVECNGNNGKRSINCVNTFINKCEFITNECDQDENEVENWMEKNSLKTITINNAARWMWTTEVCVWKSRKCGYSMSKKRETINLQQITQS